MRRPRCASGCWAASAPGAGRPTGSDGSFPEALEYLELLPETPERSRSELEIQLALGLCFIALRGYSADDTRGPFERACALSAQLGEPQMEIRALFGLWGHYWMRARHDRAIELAETLLARADLLRDPVAVIVGHRAIGSTLFTRGDFVRAREHLERAISLAVPADGHGIARLRGGSRASPPAPACLGPVDPRLPSATLDRPHKPWAGDPRSDPTPSPSPIT
jgi:hypothetical protein